MQPSAVKVDSYAASMENIEKGLDRLEKFVTE